MKLREFDFNQLKHPFAITNLAVRMEINPGQYGPWYEEISVGETLKKLPDGWENAEIKETRWFFNTFVIELKGVPDGRP